MGRTGESMRTRHAGIVQKQLIPLLFFLVLTQCGAAALRHDETNAKKNGCERFFFRLEGA